MASKVRLEERTRQLEDGVDRAQQPMRRPRFLTKGFSLPIKGEASQKHFVDPET